MVFTYWIISSYKSQLHLMINTPLPTISQGSPFGRAISMNAWAMFWCLDHPWRSFGHHWPPLANTLGWPRSLRTRTYRKYVVNWLLVVYLNVGKFAWLFSERNQSFGDPWWGCHYTFNICFDTISISIGSLPSNRVKPKSSRSSCGLLNNNGHPSAKQEKIAHMWATLNT